MPTAAGEPARRAVTIGAEVPSGAFAFRVHSVFASALNLRLEGRRFLVTLVGADADDLPHGIRLATCETFAAWPVRVGDTGHGAGGRLGFDRGAPAVDLAPARRLPRGGLPHLAPGAVDGDAWRACAAALGRRQADAGAPLRLAVLRGEAAPAGALAARLADGARALAAGVRAGDADAAADAAGRLVGLGTGLTPTGDDFVCGVLAALWCASIPDDPERAFVRAFGTALSGRLAATNAVSATFLECAIAGSFCGALVELAGALAGGAAADRGPQPEAALARLCGLGHTSGMDTATGFLFGGSIRTGAETRVYAASI